MSRRPPITQNDTLDAPQLSGVLRRDGIAALASSTSDRAQSQPTLEGLGSAEYTARAKSESMLSTDGEDSFEDYDEIKINPDTLVTNTRTSMDGAETHPNNGKTDKRKSIQVTLEKTGSKGRYVLKADDPEIRDILKKGIERQELEALNKKPRARFRDMVFTRQFTTFDRQNGSAADSPFFGFFTLFWIAMVLMFVQVSISNWRTYGSVLGNQQIIKLMLSKDVLLLGIVDGVMCGSTFFTYLLQVAVARGYINWSKSGWIVQNVWQMGFLGTATWFTYYRDWPWTHTIFIVLHCFVFLMKQHSFAFYNGYLSSVVRRRDLLERKLKQLEKIEPLNSPPTSPVASRTPSGFSSGMNGPSKRRRPSMGPRAGTNLNIEKSDVADVARAIESGRPLDLEQLQAFESIIQTEISELNKELQGKSETAEKAYPRNLRLLNFGEFICFPTLVYELDYPRQEKINWYYVAEKTTATFGVLGVMMVISQAFLYPPMAKTVRMKEQGLPFEQRLSELPFVVSEMLFPLLIEQILTWYVIWECILNVLAEVTRFADRGFYGDWWNSVSWDQYAREWNRPVHQFLLRHVYYSSISTFHLSKYSATFVTFLLSALVHEFCMAVMFKKVRLYLFWLQLGQIPLAAMSRSKFLKGRVILGNTIFWFGLFVGPSLLTSLYLIL
ncbi:hypothetical protein AMS68_004394 [Peltaster fructicola]|uniref:O-acyltransferase n=1 Tax=Peltaster fructicola TaxID=286661 RepID=A0A6H0XVU0_9PEZI|nr:hypothetical protein AMS68_004394 [Peltaster fructicola]